MKLFFHISISWLFYCQATLRQHFFPKLPWLDCAICKATRLPLRSCLYNPVILCRCDISDMVLRSAPSGSSIFKFSKSGQLHTHTHTETLCIQMKVGKLFQAMVHLLRIPSHNMRIRYIYMIMNLCRVQCFTVATKEKSAENSFFRPGPQKNLRKIQNENHWHLAELIANLPNQTKVYIYKYMCFFHH